MPGVGGGRNGGGGHGGMNHGPSRGMGGGMHGGHGPRGGFGPPPPPRPYRRFRRDYYGRGCLGCFWVFAFPILFVIVLTIVMI